MMIEIETAMKNAQMRKKRFIPGLGLQIDAVLWGIFVAIIIAAMVSYSLGLVKDSKITAAKLELDQIRTAVLQYESLSSTNTKPTSLPVLLDEMPATSSVDGMKHDSFLKANGRWSSSGLLDPWGTAYSYGTDSDGNITIQSTGSGDTISLSL